MTSMEDLMCDKCYEKFIRAKARGGTRTILVRDFFCEGCALLIEKSAPVAKMFEYRPLDKTTI